MWPIIVIAHFPTILLCVALLSAAMAVAVYQS